MLKDGCVSKSVEPGENMSRGRRRRADHEGILLEAWKEWGLFLRSTLALKSHSVPFFAPHPSTYQSHPGDWTLEFYENWEVCVSGCMPCFLCFDTGSTVNEYRSWKWMGFSPDLLNSGVWYLQDHWPLDSSLFQVVQKKKLPCAPESGFLIFMRDLRAITLYFWAYLRQTWIYTVGH